MKKNVAPKNDTYHVWGVVVTHYLNERLRYYNVLEWTQIFFYVNFKVTSFLASASNLRRVIFSFGC